MEAHPIGISILGFVCLGLFTVLVMGIIVSTVVLLVTSKNPRVRTGMVVVVALEFFVLLGLGFITSWSAARSQEQATIEYDQHAVESAYETSPQPRVTTTMLSSHGDLSPLPPFPNNDLRPEVVPEVPADALDALTTSRPAPVVPPTPNPTGDLRPDWLKKGVTKEGYVTTTVDCTGLYATEKEAEHEVLSLIDNVMGPDLHEVMSQSTVVAEPVFRGPAPSSVQALYVKDRYVEAETRDLGTVTAPMYRIWLKMEQSPQTQAKLYELYRPHVAAFRLKLVAALLVGFLAIPVGILVSARGIRATQGRGKWLWKTAGTALVLAVWVTGMMLLKLNAIIAL